MIDMKNQTVIVSPKYQVVIPREIREAKGIKPGSRMSMFEVNGVIQLVHSKATAHYRGLPSGLSATVVPSAPDRSGTRAPRADPPRPTASPRPRRVVVTHGKAPPTPRRWTPPALARGSQPSEI